MLRSSKPIHFSAPAPETRLLPKGLKVNRLPLLVAVFALLSLAGLIGAVAAWPGSGPEGVSNFGRVTQSLYRGAQPSDEGFRSLQQMGVTIDVNFRDGEANAEEREVESLGMKYFAIPWRASDEPSTTQVVEFLDIVRDNPRATIFVHCKRGADRTGTMIAAYRIAVEHESTEDALSEMHRYHYAHFWLPQLERYVDSLPQLIQTDPRFSSYANSTSARVGTASLELGASLALHPDIH